ncbi:MAG TPA: class IV adenylate cyclase [Candidatus Hydrogenedentes bacterium]|nr:class IV adenylate cyclase [Candidatus Hydrogenedentota bacterium]HPG68096.1 class IV adenylate cyclase [Candidatus Hydrogenedentota bacterium]
MRNIELKARLHDRASAEEACEALGATFQGDIVQRDTYFPVPEGRLKLRESDPGDDYLVFYRRPDAAEARGCDYDIASVPGSVRPVLEAALGTLAVVVKVRSLYWWHTVRIHLDRVEGLGMFIEFEAVLSHEHNDAEGLELIRRLEKAFDLNPEDLLACSYLDMVLDPKGSTVGPILT